MTSRPAITLRKPDVEELETASALCLRSKAYWGYNEDFMRKCQAELKLTPKDLVQDDVVLALRDAEMLGVAQISNGLDGCYLEKLFVEPDAMGLGVGRRLFEWSVATAANRGADHMIVEADPGAVPFYEAMGCTRAGTAASGSIVGRSLPRLILEISNFSWQKA